MHKYLSDRVHIRTLYADTTKPFFWFFFFLNDPATPEIYPLPLHDALPICPFHSGNVRIDPPLALAPMAEVTDTYYRSLIKELGGVGLVVSEFVSSEGLTRKNDRSHQMLAFAENERPVAIQIYGGNPDRMDDAAAIVEEQGVDIVDINMGCPVRKIVNSGAGSAMLKNFDKASRTVEKICRR